MRLRSRSKASMRGKNMAALSLRNGHAASPSSASCGCAHRCGGSTICRARRSRQKRAATSKRAHPQILIARQRRDVQQVEVRIGPQRENTGATRQRADDVVVAQRAAVIAIGIGADVSHHRARPVRRRWDPGASSAPPRPLAPARKTAGRRRRNARCPARPTGCAGSPVPGPARRPATASTLHDEIEAIRRADAVVVHRGTQVFARARIDGHEPQRTARRRAA